jgi:DNA-binding NtrC family response regulator
MWAFISETLPSGDSRILRESAHQPRTISMANGKLLLSVLVVDDEALLRWSLAEELRGRGHAVIEATTAREALDAIGPTSSSIDVILLDYRLPDSTDLGLLEEVRRRVPRCAVLLMTAHATPEMVQGALDRGAYCVLNKPFDMHTIAALVAEAYQAARFH